MGSVEYCIVEVSAYFFDEGSTISDPDDWTVLWESPWDETTVEQPKPKKKPKGNHIPFLEPHEEGTDRFTRPNLAMEFQAIGTWQCPDYNCAISEDVDLCGLDLFENWRDELAAAARLARGVAPTPPKLEEDSLESRLGWEDPSKKEFVRFLTVWKCTHMGYDDDYECDFDLVGTLDPKAVAGIATPIAKEAR